MSTEEKVKLLFLLVQWTNWRYSQPGMGLTLSFPSMSKMDWLIAGNGLHQERSSHELLKGGARCDPVEAAVFVSGVLLLERLTQQTHHSPAIRGHAFLTLVWFSFFFFPPLQLSFRL